MEQPFKNFYKRTRQEKVALLKTLGYLPADDTQSHLPEEIADQMVENYLFNYELPLGVAVNFNINEKDYVIPMVVEEPSVIAAASNGAKKIGPIKTSVSHRELIGQIVFAEVTDVDQKVNLIESRNEELLQLARSFSPSMVKRGAGPNRIWVETKQDTTGDYLIVYVGMDTGEAMGANAINTVLEGIAPEIAQLIQQPILFSILSNYSETAITTAQARIPVLTLHPNAVEAEQIAHKLELASRYAHIDVYRATTHNKGIMNGIDPVLIATGNDWRAVEAGVHAYASRNGNYESLTEWVIDKKTNELVGTISLPLAIGTVGGTIAVHPSAQWSLKLLGNPDAETLAGIVASVGLAQNFAAIFALVTDGIQKGHMALQAKSLALQAGAHVDELPQVIEKLKQKQKQPVNQAVAKEILDEIRKQNQTI
ncbi:hydroxymethylglutaryl-CoA reductase, degradative [Fundicoccus culcitae]|uniref:3-hydroxy-3-methylglutaryl coenzyme A reductase n=1 Tax=Fundicoccus culcitae TaxID=2969821 RepID=A0ABY5P5F3_9LACT|nr:hydroxymethylglutaryl-CoA reductase, degradative [Fundicoccus culcitae]UUX33983.1 hydroxymethylglutaryl-CoA reductase, degradative [Fundicoccus culcitae]